MVHQVFVMKYGNRRDLVEDAIRAMGGEPLNNPNTPEYRGIAVYYLPSSLATILDDGYYKVTIGGSSKEVIGKIQSKLEKLSHIHMRLNGII